LPVILGAAALGDDLVLVEGDANFLPVRVVAVPASVVDGTITAGPPETLLTVDGCATPAFLAGLGDDLLVGLGHGAGTDRVIRLAREPATP